MTHLSNTQKTLLLLGTGALLALPMVLSQSLVNASIQMLIAVLFAASFNLLSGQGGMLSFGHAAYFGIGSFATVHAMNAVGGNGLLPTPLLPLAGGAMGLVAGLAAGWFATKRTGVYFAMITLALAELLHSLALLYLFTLTPVGRLTLGLRENANRLRFLGYDTHRLGVLVFAVSAMFAGIAGALQALNMEAANYVVFESSASAAVVLNSYIGGVKIFLGPALGAAVMTFFGYAVSDLTRSWLLYQGIVFVLVMMFLPTGLAGLIKSFATHSKTYGLRALLPMALAFVVGTLLLAGGTVFTVEMLQRFFSQDYRSMAALNGGGWPAIALFGREWDPISPLTWLVPAALLVAGIATARLANGRWLRLKDTTPATDAPATAATNVRRNPA